MWLSSNRRPRLKRISQGWVPGTRRFRLATPTPSMDTEARPPVKLSSGESQGDKVTQVDTGNHRIDSTSCCFCFNMHSAVLSALYCWIPKISPTLDLDLNFNGFGKLSQQPVWTVAPRTAGLDCCDVDVKREAPSWRRVPLVWASLERGLFVARDKRQWRWEKAPLQRVTPLIKVRWWTLKFGYETQI